GHTAGHMSYFLWEDDCPDPPALFSGTRSAERAHPASRRPRPICSDPPSPARRRAVGGRLRLVPGGQRPADVPEPGRAGYPAPRDEGVLRPRAHAQ
ncbi:HAGHL isoform 11, partial [Pan troglodytes]